jgi:hypothetical protein
MNKAEKSKLVEKLSDITVKRLLDGDEKHINRFLNLSHMQQKLISEASPELLNYFTSMLNLVENNKENLDDFEFSLTPLKDNLLNSLTSNKANKLKTLQEEKFEKNNKDKIKKKDK